MQTGSGQRDVYVCRDESGEAGIQIRLKRGAGALVNPEADDCEFPNLSAPSESGGRPQAGLGLRSSDKV